MVAWYEDQTQKLLVYLKLGKGSIKLKILLYEENCLQCKKNIQIKEYNEINEKV